jgi:4-amino-4-deoxy-L-arabinose transferase-like glycosyltransferase
MTEPSTPEIRTSAATAASLDRFIRPIALALLALFAVLYWASAIHSGASAPLQTDDAFTLWMIKSPSIIGALKLGADTAPPAFYYFMKASCHLFGFTPLGLRIPPITALFVFVAAIYFLLRRYVGDALAGAAAILPVFATMAQAGLFARPPALMMASFALMCLVWAHDSSRHPKLWRSIALTLLLGFAISMHFYSVLFVPLLLLMEFVWATEHRFIRKAHWIAILAGGFVLVLWLPVIGPIYRMTRGSAKSPLYYARPTPLKLLDYIGHLAFDKSVLTILIALFFIASIYTWLRIARRESQRPLPRISDNLGLIAFSAAFIPFLTYAFAAVVTHVFNERYIVSATLALSVAVAILVRNLRWPKALELLFLLVVVVIYAKAVVPGLRHPVGSANTFEKAILDLPGNDPVAMPDGGSFFRVQVAGDPAIRARTVYLFLPGGQLDPDTEPSRIAHAWQTLRPDLPIYTTEDFLAQHKSFYILTWNTPGVGLTPYAKANLQTQIVSTDGDYTILKVTNDKPSAPQAPAPLPTPH